MGKDPMTQIEKCHCGQPLHYTDSMHEQVVRRLIMTLGEHVKVTRGNRSWLVSRHYIALHGLKAEDLPTLGFEEIL